MLLFFILVITISLVFYSYNHIITENVEKYNYQLTSGVLNGNYDVFMKTLQEQMRDKIPNVSFSKEISTGSINNLGVVNKRQSDFSLAQEDLFFDSNMNLNAFKKLKEPYKNLRFVSAAYFEKAHFIVPDNKDNKDNKINSFIDLAKINASNSSKKIVIGVGPKKSGSEFNFILMCLLNGINPGNYDKPEEKRGGKPPSKKIFYKNLPMNQMFNDFYSGKDKKKLHGIYLMTGTKNVFIANLVSRMDVKFIDLINDNSPLLKTAFKSYFYEKTINLGYYYAEPENQDLVKTIGTRVILFTHDKTPDNVVYEMVKDIYNKNHIYRYAVNPSEIKYYTTEYEPLELAFCKEEYTIHPGARKFYMEKNLISSNERFSNDLGNYHKGVLRNYWKYPTIGEKSFSFDRII